MEASFDSLDQILQDLSSYIRKLKKNKQYYSIVRLISQFINLAKNYNLNVSEYEYYLEKYSQEERSSHDLSPQEIDVLLSSYEERLRTIINYTPLSVENSDYAENEDKPEILGNKEKLGKTEKVGKAEMVVNAETIRDFSAEKTKNVLRKAPPQSEQEEENVFNQVIDDVLNETADNEKVEVFPLKDLAIKTPFPSPKKTEN